MAMISACAVGSNVCAARFTPVATTDPSRTMTEAKGRPPSRTLASASSIARARKSIGAASLPGDRRREVARLERDRERGREDAEHVVRLVERPGAAVTLAGDAHDD